MVGFERPGAGMLRFCLVLPILFSAAAGRGNAQEEKRENLPPAVETEGPAQLLERGRAAFAANDFAAAEAALEKFIVDYGEAEEAKEAARLHRPLVAISKVGLKKFGEALDWIDQSLLDPDVDLTVSDELRFWRGLCLMTTGDHVEAQRAFGEYWADESHNPFKRYEALLLFAHLYLLQDFPEEAADFLESQLPQVREASPEAASRSVVLELHARIAADQPERALDVIRREHGHLEEMTQLISFQSLALQLGARFLEEKKYHEAITCLQRIWPRDRLIERQEARLGEIRDRIALLETRPNTQGTVHQLQSILGRVERELESFSAIEHFDSALRLRLAMAYQGLGRYRESALILADMLATLAPDPVVESASLAEIQCWMETRHLSRAVEAADRYEKVFGAEGKSLATVLFLRAEALRENTETNAAQLAYGKLVDLFPGDPFAAKAIFMQGFLYLQQDDNEGALYQFEQVRRQFPDSELVEDADYWSGMAYSFSSQYVQARDHLEGYLKRWKTPKYRKEAIFRIAVCTFSLAEYEGSLEKLFAFNDAFPGDPLTDEANLLIGDAAFALGRNEEGFAAYDRVRPETGRFFEDAWFKKGNALKLLEDYPAMREHFERFVSDHPASGRLPEAVYWIGWTHIQDEEPGRARDIYWKTIEELGDDPDRYTMTDLLAGLPKVYSAGGKAAREELITKLRLLKSRAAVAGKDTLALRAGWALSRVVDQDRARIELLDVSKWADPRLHEPPLTVAVAEAQLDSGNRLVAKDLFTRVRKWHPRTVERDRIYRALGRIALEEGESETAIAYLERFEREASSSVQLGEVMMELAGLYASGGRGEEARAILERTLETPGAGAEMKAGALLELGRSYAGVGEDERAVVYFERLYVAYGKFGELNAKAYLERGRSLEKLDLGREALETYEELIGRDDLKGFAEVAEASQRAEVLRRRFPPESPPSTGVPTEEGAVKGGEAGG
ncbi:MAG: tetratricopeptide repeat protein [Verrucomicrobiae bacterium]|nr:tetratricopeptide repeat protein [Verrucomicrobiae bacterium]